MSMGEYISELRNTLFKINKQSWTLVSMLDENSQDKEEAGAYEQETLDKAKSALATVIEILGRL
jgi:hypothetical protein